MSEEKLYFTMLKEGRDGFFVEYRPPIHGFPFAILQLTYPKRVDLVSVAESMEMEAILWYDRFPIPIMVSAFDEFGDLLHLEAVRPENHLFVLRRPETGAVERHWRHFKNEELPSDALNRDVLLKIYSDVGHKTSTQLHSEAKSHAKRMRVGWFIVFCWVAVAPAAFLILEFFGPEWLAALVFVYGLSQAVVKALKMLGKWKKSAPELAAEEEERRMRHHHYHCERNPEGFLHLKMENFRKEQREAILREAESLKPTDGEAANKLLHATRETRAREQ